MTLPDFDPEIDRMTAYCTYCPKMCRFSCPTASAESRETVTPWGMMRLLELVKDGSVAIDHEVADAFYHCTGCRRCQTYCEHDNDVARALWEARRWVVGEGVMPEAYVELREQFDDTGTPYDAPETDEIDESAFHESASVAFWPDCSTVRNQPELVGAVGRLLERLLDEKVRLVRSEKFDHPPCCGFPLTGAGLERPDSCREELWPTLKGVELIWTDCPGMAAWDKPESSWSSPDDGPSVAHIFELLAERLDDIEPDEKIDFGDRLLHESCYVTRQLEAGDAVASIIDAIREEAPERMAYRGDASPCCGGRCHYRVLEPDAAERAASKVVESLDRHDESERMMTTSSMCRQAMADAEDEDVVTSLLEAVCMAYGTLRR